MGLQSVPVEGIEMVQSRTNLDMMVIQEYAEAMAAGVHFPPINILIDTDGKLWCWDGCHRTMAARQAGLRYIQADVSSGSRRDALLLAAGANSNHGLRRTNDDKRRAVQILLDDPEWSAWSDREIARRCNVSNTFVSKLRSATVNVDSTAAEHTYTRAGQRRTMNTSNIGKRRGVGAWWTANDTNQIREKEKTRKAEAAVTEPELRPGFPNYCPIYGLGHTALWLDDRCTLGQCQYHQSSGSMRGCMHPERDDSLPAVVQVDDKSIDSEPESMDFVPDEDDFGARAVGSLALALKSDNCHAWHLMSGMTMPVFDSRDVDEMRRALADKILIRELGYQYSENADDVRKFFQQHNIYIIGQDPATDEHATVL